MERYYGHRSTGLNVRQSWEATEAELWEFYRLERYTTYNSFVKSKTAWVKKRQVSKRVEVQMRLF